MAPSTSVPSLALSPLRSSLHFGRRVDNVSVAEILSSPALQEAVVAALDKFGLLLFQNEELSPAEEVAFAQLFPWDATAPVVDYAGPYATVEATGVYGVGAGGTGTQSSTRPKLYGQANAPHADRWKLPSLPMVQIQGHGKVCGHHGVADGVLSSSQDFAEWHTDGVHDVPLTTNPPAVTTMYCLDTPAQGGETLFASSREGFAALPERLKVRARRLSAALDGRFRTTNRQGTRALPSEVYVEAKDEMPLTNRWPLVTVDEATGGETLYCIAPAFTRHLIETGDDPHGGSACERILTAEESQAVLGEILEIALHIGSPNRRAGGEGWAPSSDGSVAIDETPNLLVHRWAVGDLAIWSNRTMLHSASPSPRYTSLIHGSSRRLFHRVRMSSRLPVTPALFSPSDSSAAAATTATAAASATRSAAKAGPLLTTYCRLWAVQQLLLCGAFGYAQSLASELLSSPPASLSPATASETMVLAPSSTILLAPLLLLLLLRPSPQLLFVSHACVLARRTSELPFVWDFLVWDLLTDTAVAAAVACVYLSPHYSSEPHARHEKHRNRHQTAAVIGEMAIRVAAPIVRAQYLVLYFCTALWKLNTTFLDTTRSCAPIFFLQLLDACLPDSLTPAWLPRRVAHIAPAVTVIVEGAIPVLLSTPGRLRRGGIALGLLLHLLIAATPPPNNAGAFSIALMVRYFFFAPEEVAAAAHDKGVLSIGGLLAAFGLAKWGGSDLAPGVYLGMASLHAAALLRAESLPSILSSSSSSTASSPSIPSPSSHERLLSELPTTLPPMRHGLPPLRTPRLKSAAVVAAVVYALVLPVLGLQDMMASTMFANLRVFSGSNHLVLPTGILFSPSLSSLFPTLAGGIVWVESTTSAYIRGIYPAEVTAMLPRAVVHHLVASGHTGRQFAPYLARVLGPAAVAPPPPSPSSSSSSTPPPQLHESVRPGADEAWMVPMVELRRLLAEARTTGEPFRLVYRQRGVASGWRRVRVEYTPPSDHANGDGHLSCAVLGEWLPLPWSACTAEEATLLSSAPPSWAMRSLLFFPFPMRMSGGGGGEESMVSSSSPELGCLA